MRTTEYTISRGLEEVWEWKDAVYEVVKDMTPNERIAYYQGCMERAAKFLNARLVKNPDGSYSLV